MWFVCGTLRRGWLLRTNKVGDWLIVCGRRELFVENDVVCVWNIKCV